MWSLPRPDVVCMIAGACLLAVPHQDVQASGAAPRQEVRAPGIDRLVDRIENRYEDAEIRAHFVQHRLSRLGSVMNSAEGELYIATPGRMRWEYTTTDQLIVAGGPGRETYIYLPEDNEVQVLHTDTTDPSQYPIMYLSGRGNLRRDFDVEVVEWGTLLARGNVQLELRPRRSGAAFERLILEVDPVQATIVRMVDFDNLRNVLEYQFHDVQYDVVLDDEIFEFDIPAGANVVHIGG